MAMLGSINGVLMEGLDGDNTWRLQDYVDRGGYAQLRRILETKMTQEEVISEVKKIRASWTWWRRLSDGPEMVVHAALLPGGQVCCLQH